MHDRKSTKKPLGHIKKHLSLTINAPLEVKDEAYVQVLKQIKDHPDKIKAKRGWSFFCVLACTYAPSSELYYSILNSLLCDIKENTDQEIVKRANFIFIRLVKFFQKPRKFVPSDKEILYIEVKSS